MRAPSARGIVQSCFLGLVLAAGCTQEVGSAGQAPRGKATKAADSPQAAGSTPSPAPSSTASAAVSPGPSGSAALDVSSGIDTTYTAPPVETQSPVIPAPSTTPASLGALTLPIALGAEPVALAFLRNGVRPFILRAADFVEVGADNQVGAPIGQAGGQGAGMAADGPQDLWLLWTAPHRAERWQPGTVGLALAKAFTMSAAPAAVAAEGGEAWVALGGGTLVRIKTSPESTASFAGFGTPTAVALTPDSVWVTSATNQLFKVSRTAGTVTATFATGALPVGVAADASGSVWTADRGASAATRVAPDGSTSSIPLGAAPAAVLAGTRVWFAVPGKLLYYRLDGTKEGEVALEVDEFYRTRTFDPSSLAADAQGRIWALDRAARQAVAVSGKQPGE